MNFVQQIEEDQRVRNLLLNNILMDENRKFYDKRYIQKPGPFYASKYDYELQQRYDPRYIADGAIDAELTKGNYPPEYRLDLGEVDTDPASRFVRQRVF